MLFWYNNQTYFERSARKWLSCFKHSFICQLLVRLSEDKSLTSMRDLFRRLKIGGIDINISTFSKASKKREVKLFEKIYKKLTKKIQSRSDRLKYSICPIDSTVITLTSKLLHNLDLHQVKLFSNFNTNSGFIEENLINFGGEHDYKFGERMINFLPVNGVGVLGGMVK